MVLVLICMPIDAFLMALVLAVMAGSWAQRRWPDAVTAEALRRYRGGE